MSSINVNDILSQVSQSVSQCCALISCSDEDPTPHLSDVSHVLSEMNELVKIIADKQQQKTKADPDQHELWWDPSDVTMLSSTPSSCSSSVVSSDELDVFNVGDLFVQEDCFIAKMSKAIERFAPNKTFSRAKHERRMKRKMMKLVHREFHCLWKHVDVITGIAPAVAPVKPPALKVNWSLVNTRALANLPKPQLYPKLGCSEDPAFYQPYEGTVPSVYEDSGKRRVTFKPKHQQDNPFGSEYGVETSMGVMCVKDLVLFGHIWSEERGSWLLHASYQSDEGDSGERSRDRGDRRSRYRGDRSRRNGG